MTKLTLENLGRKLEAKRASLGVRAAAKEIGISPATLSRVERGHMPDLATFKKICMWLNIDPGEVLGISGGKTERLKVAVNFRKDHAIHPDTAKALSDMIMAAQRAFMATEE
ncbi:MAG: helix-turn-helix domain-containing protein [Candidatus Nitrospinota bacterium M3_3B_026]